MDIGSGFQPLLGDAHVAACGMEIEGLRPFDASRRRNGGCGPSMHPGEETGAAALQYYPERNAMQPKGANGAAPLRYIPEKERDFSKGRSPIINSVATESVVTELMNLSGREQIDQLRTVNE